MREQNACVMAFSFPMQPLSYLKGYDTRGILDLELGKTKSFSWPWKSWAFMSSKVIIEPFCIQDGFIGSATCIQADRHMFI